LVLNADFSAVFLHNGELMSNIIFYIQQGGIFMYPILLGTLWAMTLLIERTIFFIHTGVNMSSQVKTFFSHLNSHSLDEAFTYLKKKKGVLRDVLLIGIENRKLPVDRVSEKMEMVLLEQLPGYSKYLDLLAALAGLMPIFGLLGTVSGMIMTFNVISLHGTGDAQAMASGIAEALTTTQAGLVAAAPMILGHVLLVSRLKKISDKTKEACVKLIDYLKENQNSV
jgi:biopolymer transport protein ExbB